MILWKLGVHMYNKGGLIPLIGLPKTQHLLNISLRPETMKQLEKKNLQDFGVGKDIFEQDIKQ